MTPEPARQPKPRVASAILWCAVTAFALGLAAFRQLPFLLPPWLVTLPLLLGVVGLYCFPGRTTAVLVALLAGPLRHRGRLTATLAIQGLLDAASGFCIVLESPGRSGPQTNRLPNFFGQNAFGGY